MRPYVIDHIIYKGQRYTVKQFRLEAELEQLVTHHATSIFGDSSMYFSVKPHLKSQNFTTIPDGYLLDLSTPSQPRLNLVEVELAKHDTYRHVMVQLAKFSPLSDKSKIKIKQTIIKQLSHLSSKKTLPRALKNHTQPLSDILDHALFNDKSPPKPLVVVDEVTHQLQDAVSRLNQNVDLLQVKTYTHPTNKPIFQILNIPVPKHIDPLSQIKISENPSKFFDMAIDTVKTGLKALGNHTYEYSYECTYLPQKTFASPAKLQIMSIDACSTLEIKKLEGFQEYRSHQEIHSSPRVPCINLESTFKSPFVINKPLKTKVVIQTYAPHMPPHLFMVPNIPIQKSLTFEIDLSKLHDKVTVVKLLEYVTRNAPRPTNPSSETNSRSLNKDRRLTWKISNPQLEHLYLLTWKEPCDCDLCRHRISS